MRTKLSSIGNWSDNKNQTFITLRKEEKQSTMGNILLESSNVVQCLPCIFDRMLCKSLSCTVPVLAGLGVSIGFGVCGLAAGVSDAVAAGVLGDTPSADTDLL